MATTNNNNIQNIIYNFLADGDLTAKAKELETYLNDAMERRKPRERNRLRLLLKLVRQMQLSKLASTILKIIQISTKKIMPK